MGYGYGMMSGWGGWGGFGVGWLFMLLWWGLILAVVVGLIRWLFTGHGASSGPSHAPQRHLDILKERYARGEIDRDTYNRMRQELEH